MIDEKPLLAIVGALTAVALGLSGCFGSGDDLPGADRICGSEVKSAPCAGASTGVEYRYYLEMHCGIEVTWLDGRWWVPKEKVDRPSDWGDSERGSLTLVSDNEAVFVGPGEITVRFEPAPEGFTPPPCM